MRFPCIRRARLKGYGPFCFFSMPGPEHGKAKAGGIAPAGPQPPPAGHALGMSGLTFLFRSIRIFHDAYFARRHGGEAMLY